MKQSDLSKAQIKALNLLIKRAKESSSGLDTHLVRPDGVRRATMKKLVEFGLIDLLRIDSHKHYKYTCFGKNFSGCKFEYWGIYKLNVEAIRNIQR